MVRARTLSAIHASYPEAPDWAYGSVLQPDPETRPAASVRTIDVASSWKW